MSFAIEKRKTLGNAKGKLEMRSFTTKNNDTMEAINEDDIYKYLGHMQTKQMKHTQMKQKLGEEYLCKSHKEHIKDKVKWKKYDESYKYLCDPSTAV